MRFLQFWKNDLLVAAVCHGPASVPGSNGDLLRILTWDFPSALIQAKGSNGKSIFEGKKVTALSNVEEEAHGYLVEVKSRLGSNALQADR